MLLKCVTGAQSCYMRKNLVTSLLLGLLMVLSPAGSAQASNLLGGNHDDTSPPFLTYGEILEVIVNGEARAASFYKDHDIIVVTLNDGTPVQAYYPAAKGPGLVVTLLETGTPIRLLPDSLIPAYIQNTDTNLPDAGAEKTGGGLSAIGMLAGAVALIGFVVFLVVHNRRGKQQSKHDKEVAAAEGKSTTTFADVAGCEEAIDDLRELVDFLKNPERFTKLGAKIPKGALLAGPPGTGKTLLAKAVAGEADVPFLPATGSDFVELYVGVGAKRIRELFAKANEHGKAIIFIDEIDAIGRVRSENADSSSGAHVEQENTLLALLSELDGFKETGVIVIGATNRPDILDPALTRPGRLERKVQVPNPDRRGREHILMVHTANKPLHKDVDLGTVALRTPGSSGADLAAIANEAAMEAARRDLQTITHDCFEDAISTVLMGRARHSTLVTEHDREITAWHEAGHALVALLETDADNPLSVSIIPRGGAGGVTWMSSTDDQFMSRHKAKARLTVALAGRAGEELLLDGEFTQGAQSDLVTATKLAGAMVTRFGMSRKGLQVRQKYDGTFDVECEEVVDELLQEAMARARAVLSANHSSLETLALGLLEYGTLNLNEIRVLLEGKTLTDRQKPIRVLPEPRKLLHKKILDRLVEPETKNGSLGARVKQQKTKMGALARKLGKKPQVKPETA